MTLTSLLRLADRALADDWHPNIRDVARELATSISALLSPPPGALAWEQPVPDNVAHDGACVTVPASWGGIRVRSEDARAMAVMLLLAADLAEEGNNG